MHQGQRPYSCVLCSRDFCQSADLERHLETHVNLGPTARAENEVDLYTLPTAPKDVSVHHDSHSVESSLDNYSDCFSLSDQPEMTDSMSSTDPRNKNDWNYTEVFSESGKMKDTALNASQRPSQKPRQDSAAKGKLHQCLICSKHFGSPYKLRRHQLIHTGERPFKCSLCDKAFTQLPHLKLHSQSHCRRDSVKAPRAVSDPSSGQTPTLSSPTHLHVKTAISSPTHTNAHEAVQTSCFTLADRSPTEAFNQDHAKPPYMVYSLCESIPASELHLSLQVKAPYAYNGIPSPDQAAKNKKLKVSSSPKTGRSKLEVAHNDFEDNSQLLSSYVEQTVSTGCEIEGPSHLVDNNQMVLSNASKLLKACELSDAGQKERSPQKGTYKCQTCFKSFLVPSKLHRHMMTHTGQRPFACHVCAKSFRQLCHLKLHLRTRVCLKQPNKPIKRNVRNIAHKFPRDSRPLTSASKMFVHSDVGGDKTGAQSYRSKTGAQDFGTCVPALSVVSRVRRKSSDSNRPTYHHTGSHSQYESTNLDQTSEKSQAVSVHTCRIVHECPVCFKCFSSPSKLKRHCLIHTGQRPFQCYICHRAFRQLAHLKVHYKVHEQSGRKMPCFQRQGFKNHHHGRAPTPRLKAYTCNLCGWKFRHPTHLTVHLQNHKSLVGTTPSPVSPLVKDSQRQSSMSSIVHKMNEPSPECASGQSMCSGKINSYNTLQKTQCDFITSDFRANRQSQNRHCCSVCFKSFDCPTKLQRHSLCHSGLRPFKCLICSKEFTHRAHMKVHRCLSKEGRSIILPVKDSNLTCNEVLIDQSQSVHQFSPLNGNDMKSNYVMPSEGSSNRDQVNLYTPSKKGKIHATVLPEPTHLQQKTTEMPTKQQKRHLCNICQRHFSVPSKLARHLLIHMGIKPFTCQVCGRSFRQSCHLQTHLNVHRNRKLSRIVSGRENSNRQGGVFKPGPQLASQNRGLLKENAVKKQNAIQKSAAQIRSLEYQVCGEKVGKIYPLPPSKSKNTLTKNSCDVGYVETAGNQWNKNTSSQSHSTSTCVTNEAHAGLFVGGEVNSCTPEFASMPPIVHRDQNSSAHPKNQIFMNASCNNTTVQYKLAPDRQEWPLALAETQKPIMKRANRCSICLKKFDSPSKLARHFLIHMGLKPYKCQVCSKSFRQLCHLQTHRKVHNKKNTPNTVPGCTKSHPTNRDVESSSNRPVFDPASHQGNLSQSSHFPHNDHYERNQPLVPFVNESGQSEIKSTDYGFDNISDHKQEPNFTMQPLTHLLSSDEKHDFTDSKRNTPRLSPSRLLQLTNNPQEIKQASTPPACPSYSIMETTLASVGHVQKAEQCHGVNQSEHLVDRWKNSGDDERAVTQGSRVSNAQAAQAHFKEEVFELQFELDGVDNRLSKPPNDLLICPDCSQCFASERKLRTHKCVSGAEEKELQRPNGGYQCAICFKSFQVPSKLKRHYVIHTGHRPFQCSVCAKTFTQSAHLKTHLNTHK